MSDFTSASRHADVASIPVGPNVASWTRLQVPTSITIEDSSSEDGQKWLKAGTYLNPDKAPGFKGSCFGRTREAPETMWYITVWESHLGLDRFEATGDYLRQREEYARFSTAPLETHRCDLMGADIWSRVTENVEVFDAFFPIDISEEARKLATSIRGLVYHYAPPGRGPRDYRSRPARGWVHGKEDYEGREIVALRFVHFWRSEESEKVFKSSSGITIQPTQYLTLYNHMLEQLQEAGMVDHRAFHCNLKEIPNYWRDDYPVNGDESEEDYEN